MAEGRNEGKSSFGARKDRFSHIRTLRAALNLVASPVFQHDMYQHYTTLENVLTKISKGEWWLSCCTSDRLNDQKEAVKYGSLKKARTLYQTCFSHSAAESVAMWGLYQCSKPCAVRISFTKQTLSNWIDALKKDTRKTRRFSHVLFRDLVYLAVSNPNDRIDEHNIKRTNCVSWEGVTTQKIEGLEDEIVEEWATGLVKDCEWRHERETRLLVELPKHTGQGIKIDIPDNVLEDLRFTFSPWLSPNMEAIVRKLITNALSKRLKRDPKKLKQRFRRSVLFGGLLLGDGRVPCAFCDDCKLFGRNECRI